MIKRNIKRVFEGDVLIDESHGVTYQSHYIEDKDGEAIGTNDMLKGLEGKKVKITIEIVR